jgi:hypothetical protein
MAELGRMRSLIGRMFKLSNTVATVTCDGNELFSFNFSEVGDSHPFAWTNAIIAGLKDKEVNLEVRIWFYFLVCVPIFLVLTRTDAARSASRLMWLRARRNSALLRRRRRRCARNSNRRRNG